MQIKAADGRTHDIVELERLLERPDVPAATKKRIDIEIRNIRAGEKAEEDAAYDIELHFGRSENWVTLHDLRIEIDGLAAQMDHLIINRLAEIWVCESKSFSEGVSVNEHGEWVRWWHGRAEGIPSPIEQNNRHIVLLERVFDDRLVQLPKRLGLLPMRPDLRSLVLVSNNARIGRPKRPVKDMEQVIKAEKLKTTLFDAFDKSSSVRLGRVIGKEALLDLGRQLASLHQPASFDWPARFGLAASPLLKSEAALATTNQPPRTEAHPRKPWVVKFDGPCSRCGRILVKGTPAVWDQSIRKMRCLDCTAGLA